MGKCHNFTSNFQAWGEFQGLDLREVCYFKRRPPTMSSLLPSPGPGVLTPSSKETWCPHSIPKMVLETFIRVTLREHLDVLKAVGHDGSELTSIP